MTAQVIGRRVALRGSLGVVAAGMAFVRTGEAARAVEREAGLMPADAGALRDLSLRLARLPRRRDFKTVPMILTSPDQWDYEALDAIIAYQAPHKQVWDNTNIDGGWLNLMRNTLNAQVWSFRHPEFLAVSATHGTANLALYDQAAWDKYRLAKLAGERFKTNSLIVSRPAEAADPAAFESPVGAFSPEDNAIPALVRRGVVFMACHNAVWEQALALIKADANPDKLSHEALAADLTNHLLPEVVLTPGAVATLPELQRAGFHYARS